MKNRNMNVNAPVNGTAALAPEVKLTDAVSAIKAQIAGLMIKSEADYDTAAGMAKSLKGLQKEVKDYWEPMRKAAKAAYDAVLGKKKEMLTPLETAEGELKGKMSGYVMEQERKRQAQEAALRAAARAEAERKLEAAADAERFGDVEGAEYAMAEAEAYETLGVTGTVIGQKVKASGIAHTKSWKIKAVDPALVPVNLNGVELRPVDMGAVMRLIKATKGTVKIPGVVYEEDVQISVRA